jgi:exopolyphosphatase/guanosine-5'-triphosphate,3'-diphosphate pyrophosphatase
VRAVIDIGSNTVRMLIGEWRAGQLYAPRYYRRITRLAGGMKNDNRLSQAGCQRTLAAVQEFVQLAAQAEVAQIAAVGTAALRRAVNRQDLLERIEVACGLTVAVIPGSREARLAAQGVLSVLAPQPRQVLILDIGGGSTELIGWRQGEIGPDCSFPLGVVPLSENFASVAERRTYIARTLEPFRELFCHWRDPDLPCPLVGTAGTITTLAALYLRLREYAPDRVNNQRLNLSWLEAIYTELEPLSPAQRETLEGMEEGRGDLILPGLDILLSLLAQLQLEELTVADSGLLEGLLFELSGGD